MANTFGTLNPNEIAARSMDILKAKFPHFNNISSNFSDQAVDYGSSVITRINTPGVASSYTTAVGFSAQPANDTDVTVTINKFKYSSYEIFPTEVSSHRDIVAESTNKIGVELANAFYGDLFALATTGNYATNNVTVMLSAATRTSVLVAADTKLSNSNVDGPKFGIYNGALTGKLWEDESMVKQSWGAGGIGSSTLPVVMDIASHRYNALPSTGNLMGVIGRKDAWAIATRLPNDPASQLARATDVNTVVYTDAETGLSIQLRMFVNDNFGSLKIVGSLQYGVAVGNPLAMSLIING